MEQTEENTPAASAFRRIMATDPGRLAFAHKCVGCDGHGVIVCEWCDEGVQEKDCWDGFSELHYTESQGCRECDGEPRRHCDECDGEGVSIDE